MIEEKVPGIRVSKKPYIKTSFEVWVGGELLFSKLKMKTFPDFSAIVDSVYNTVVKGEHVQVWKQRFSQGKEYILEGVSGEREKRGFNFNQERYRIRGVKALFLFEFNYFKISNLNLQVLRNNSHYDNFKLRLF